MTTYTYTAPEYGAGIILSFPPVITLNPPGTATYALAIYNASAVQNQEGAIILYPNAEGGSNANFTSFGMNVYDGGTIASIIANNGTANANDTINLVPNTGGVYVSISGLLSGASGAVFNIVANNKAVATIDYNGNIQLAGTIYLNNSTTGIFATNNIWSAGQNFNGGANVNNANVVVNGGYLKGYFVSGGGAATTISVGSSPFTYANTTDFVNGSPTNQEIFIVGGTITAISYTPSGESAISISPTTSALILRAGDSITITYTTAPVMYSIQV